MKNFAWFGLRSRVASQRELVAFLIELSIDEHRVLFLVLAADGAVNRAGSGRLHPAEPDLCIAQSDGTQFQTVRPLFDQTWLDLPPLQVLPGQEGPEHRLRLTFFCADGRKLEKVEIGYEYRMETQPPPAIQAFVQGALDATQSWYDEFREQVAIAESKQGRKFP